MPNNRKGTTKETHYAKKNLSTKEKTSLKRAWFCEKNGVKSWPGSFAPSPTEGSCSFVTLELAGERMLTRHHRFSGSKDIRMLYKKGSTARTRYMSAHFRYSEERPWRATVVVSKKVHKSAVVRNRIRRRIYELLRTRHDKELPGVQVVITVYDSSIAFAPAPKLQSELYVLLVQKIVQAQTLQRS